MADIFRIGSDLEDLTVGEPHAITGLIVDIDDETYFIAGDDSGFIVEVTCPWVTGTEQTQLILDRIKGITFTPYEASEVIIDPSAELGDYFMCPNFSGGIFSKKSDFFGTMDSDLSLPYSEEEDHEYTYIPPETRNYKREISTVKEEFTAEITATAQGIRSDVAATYATQDALEDAVTDSQSYLEQNALKISAGVVTSFGEKDGHIVTPSFNWALTARAFKIYTNNEEDPEFAFTVDSSGQNPRLTVRGTVKAEQGIIGYWQINGENQALYNGIPFTGHYADGDDNNGSTGMGSYGGSWAFWAGDGRFRVDRSGNVVCRNIQVQNGSTGAGGSGTGDDGYADKSTLFADDEITYDLGIGGGLTANNVFSGVEYADCLYTNAFISNTTSAEFYRGLNIRTTVFHMAATGYGNLRQVSLGTITDSGGTQHKVLVWS